jgi:hypothetical protein
MAGRAFPDKRKNPLGPAVPRGCEKGRAENSRGLLGYRMKSGYSPIW